MDLSRGISILVSSIVYVGMVGGSSIISLAAALIATHHLPTTTALPNSSITTRILPLGDSITSGEGAPGGYRGHLFTNLTSLGYNVDFLGNENNNPASSSVANFDTSHEGHSGWRIDEIDRNIERWLDLIGLAPDVILVHIGTNDFGMFCVHDMICPSYDVGFVYVPR